MFFGKKNRKSKGKVVTLSLKKIQLEHHQKSVYAHERILVCEERESDIILPLQDLPRNRTVPVFARCCPRLLRTVAVVVRVPA